MRWDCPQRQGSQDFRTTQSQLVVDQESKQFIHPHPSMGQRNQFQSQGAIQAPSAAQMGQRGQSVGRGQVQGSKSGTSTTRKKLINDTLNASLKSYNDASLKCHGLDCHCICLHTMTLIASIIFCVSKL